MIYLSVRESNRSEPSLFLKIDRKEHELRLTVRNQVAQRLKSDTQLLWRTHMLRRGNGCTAQGYFLRHLPQCLMQLKSPHDAIGKSIQTFRHRESFG